MIFVRYAKGLFKEAEQAGYQAMQVTAEQQAAHVPVTETTREIQTPMDVDQEAKDTGSGVKRKAEEEPSEESKKARVGACSIASCL
jgi:hypothetical protein